MTEPSPTVGVVVVTHGNFGIELVRAAETVLGEQERCFGVCVDVNREVGSTVEVLRSLAKKADAGAGVLLLTDLFGGSPTTLSLSLLKKGEIEVITGVNLPMIIKALQSRAMKLQEVATVVREAGIQGIVAAGELLRSRRPR